eukprot:1728984-Rhodomonas_salina.2
MYTLRTSSDNETRQAHFDTHSGTTTSEWSSMPSNSSETSMSDSAEGPLFFHGSQHTSPSRPSSSRSSRCSSGSHRVSMADVYLMEEMKRFDRKLTVSRSSRRDSGYSQVVFWQQGHDSSYEGEPHQHGRKSSLKPCNASEARMPQLNANE